MIDIIIPIYNSLSTLSETLLSVLEQKNIPKIKIYLIDDCSDEDYSEIIKKYSDKLDIVYKKIDSNRGPGYCRNYGISVSGNKYIVFLDSDDKFYDEYSLSNLYNAIENKKVDVVRSVIHEEFKGNIKVYKNENIGLHGKIYRRSFIVKNDISFSEERSNEDMGFNFLINLCGAKYEDIDDVTYLWCDNPNSITRKKIKDYINVDHKYYAFHLYWAIKEAIKRDYDNDRMIYLSINSLIDLYSEYLKVKDNEIKIEIKKYATKVYGIIKNLVEGSLEDFINKCKYSNFYDKEVIRDIIAWLNNNIVNGGYEKFAIYSKYEWRERCEHLEMLKKFNNTIMGNDELTKKMFASFGDNSIIVPPISANCGCKNLYVGDRCFINFNLSIVDDGNIYVDDDVIIGPDVKILTVNHPIDPKERLRKKIIIEDVHIKKNAWIGSSVIILPGVTIGENTVIGAGSVVTKDIPDNVLAFGNPCKVIKKI